MENKTSDLDARPKNYSPEGKTSEAQAKCTAPGLIRMTVYQGLWYWGAFKAGARALPSIAPSRSGLPYTSSYQTAGGNQGNMA